MTDKGTNGRVAGLLREYNRLTKERTSDYHRLARRAGLSDAAFWTLYVLCLHEGPVSQADVRRECMSSKQTVNSAIVRLRDEGLLELTGNDTGKDARRKILSLTEEGRAVCERWVEPVVALDLAALASLGKEGPHYLELMRAEHAVFLGGAEGLLAADADERALGVPVRAPSGKGMA